MRYILVLGRVRFLCYRSFLQFPPAIRVTFLYVCVRVISEINYCQIHKYPHFAFKFGEINAFLRNRYIVELSLFLSEELKPSARGRFDKFRYAEGQGPHKIVSRRSIPIPHLDQQPPVFVLRLEVANSKIQFALIVALCSLRDYLYTKSKVIYKYNCVNKLGATLFF